VEVVASLKVAQLLHSAACLHTNQSRSYLNHLVVGYTEKLLNLKVFIKILSIIVQEFPCILVGKVTILDKPYEVINESKDCFKVEFFIIIYIKITTKYCIIKVALNFA